MKGDIAISPARGLAHAESGIMFICCGAALTSGVLGQPPGEGQRDRRPPAHLIHGGVEGEELGVPVGAARLLVQPLELLGAEVPQQLLQPRVRPQAAQLQVRAGQRPPRGLLRDSVRVLGPPRLLENTKMARCGLGTRLARNMALGGLAEGISSAMKPNGEHGALLDATTDHRTTEYAELEGTY